MGQICSVHPQKCLIYTLTPPSNALNHLIVGFLLPELEQLDISAKYNLGKQMKLSQRFMKNITSKEQFTLSYPHEFQLM